MSSVSIVAMSLAGIDPTVDVDDVVVFEDSHYLTDRVRLANGRQELIAQSLSGRGAAHDARDVDEGHGRANDLLGVEHLGQDAESLVGYGDHTHVGLDGGEGVVRRQHVVLRQGVEEC